MGGTDKIGQADLHSTMYLLNQDYLNVLKPILEIYIPLCIY